MGKRSKRRKRRQKQRQSQPAQERRLWEAANTHRLNEAHWQQATSEPINLALEQDLKTIVDRCRFEKHNNPMVEGVVQTHTIDLVGETGPSLQVMSDSPRYNRLLEEIFEEFWASCTVCGMHGVDLIARYNENDWDQGNSIAQVVDMSHELPSDSIIKTRLVDIAPYRLIQPFHHYGERVSNGVRVDQYGRPTHYYIQPRTDLHRSDFMPKEYLAQNIMHWFDRREADQVVGYPRLASSLPDIADLRDYDTQVMDAARTAADNAFMLVSQPGAVEFLEGAKVLPHGQAISVPRRTGRVIMAGYEPKQMAAVHPLAQYVEFRHEKLRSLGRPVHMPLLVALLSAQKSNFSQSRIDLNVLYERGLNFLRGKWERYFLTPLVKLVEREASLATFYKSGTQRFVLGRRPKKVSFAFGWEPLGQANPKDYAIAVEKLLKLGLTSEIRELSKIGIKPDQIMRDRAAWEQLKVDFGVMLDEIEPGDGQRSQTLQDLKHRLDELFQEALAA